MRDGTRLCIVRHSSSSRGCTTSRHPWISYAPPLLYPSFRAKNQISKLLIGTFSDGAYHEFAFTYLTRQDLSLFGNNISFFANEIDLDRLDRSILEGARSQLQPTQPIPSLWLLAHVIALHRIITTQTSHARYLETLYLLLCLTSNRVREGFAASGSRTKDSSKWALPVFISQS
jgi:hypothetical protein